MPPLDSKTCKVILEGIKNIGKCRESKPFFLPSIYPVAYVVNLHTSISDSIASTLTTLTYCLSINDLSSFCNWILALLYEESPP
jgi:hypothetical protein